MEDYPRNQAEFESRFGTEAACRQYIIRLRWPQGFVCPRCDAEGGWPTSRDLIACSACGYHCSVTAGTIFERTRKPLVLWFRAMWSVTSAKTGSSAMTVKRVLGLGSYQTAWTWLHKLRRAMVTPGRDRLRGTVEVDETLIGATEPGRHGRQLVGKAMIAVAAERNGKGTGRIRMRRVPNGRAVSLHPFIEDSIQPGSTICTDDWHGYLGIEAKGYQHQVKQIAGSGQTGSELMPRVHRAVSLLKRWLMGTHQGAVSHEHLDYYLDEFTFRFNRRTSRSRGKLFYRLVQNAVRTPATPYRTMVKALRGRRKKKHNI